MPTAGKNGMRMYQRIRRYIDKIYLYGFLTRKDFARLHNGSAKDYDETVKLIKELFGEDGFQKKRGQPSVSRDYHTSGNRRLQDTYMLCQLDPQDVAEYLHVLNVARTSPGNAHHFVQRLQLQALWNRSVGTVYNRLEQLHHYGCLQMRDGVYSLAQDGLDGLTDRQLLDLYEYARFCSCTAYPRVAAGALCRTLACRLAERGIRVEEEAPFLLRHNPNFHVLDEEQVYRLGQCIQQRRWARFDDRLRLPLILRLDTQLGRWYALCAGEEGGAVIERLSNVATLTPEDKIETPEAWELLRQRVERVYSHGLFSGRGRKPVKVCAKLEFADNPGLRNQFLREIRIGRVLRRDGVEYYEAQLRDPRELKPLLRAYGAYLRILPGDHDLRSDLREHYYRMLAALEEDTV